MSDPMHPNGRCTCCGEGKCLWCQLIDANDSCNAKDETIAALRRMLATVVSHAYPDSAQGYCGCEDGDWCIGCDAWRMSR